MWILYIAALYMGIHTQQVPFITKAQCEAAKAKIEQINTAGIFKAVCMER